MSVDRLGRGPWARLFASALVPDEGSAVAVVATLARWVAGISVGRLGSLGAGRRVCGFVGVAERPSFLRNAKVPTSATGSNRSSNSRTRSA